MFRSAGDTVKFGSADERCVVHTIGNEFSMFRRYSSTITVSAASISTRGMTRPPAVSMIERTLGCGMTRDRRQACNVVLSSFLKSTSNSETMLFLQSFDMFWFMVLCWSIGHEDEMRGLAVWKGLYCSPECAPRWAMVKKICFVDDDGTKVLRVPRACLNVADFGAKTICSIKLWYYGIVLTDRVRPSCICMIL